MRRCSFWLMVALGGGAGLLQADPVPRLDPAIELQKQQQLERLQRQLETPRPELAEPPPPPRPADTATAACAPVRRIQIDGVTRLGAGELRTIVLPFEGRCLTQADINQLLQAVNAAYTARGYITSRAYLPEQRLSDGTLRLVVIEGTIEDLRLNDNRRPSDRARLAGAFPTRPGRVLRLQDIEQGVDQLNRAPSAQAAVALEPGTAPGATRVVVRTLDERSWRAGLTLDNSGEAATGRFKFTGTLDKDNLLERNDLWQLALSRTRDSRAVSVSPTLPFGYWTLTGSYSQSHYSNALNNGFTLTGESTSALLGLERLFFRNQREQWSFTLGLTDRDSARDIAGVALTPDSVTTLRTGLRWLHRDPGVSGLAQLTWVHGTDWLGATADPALPSAFPHHQFDKLELQGQLSRRLGPRWTYATQLQGQYTRRGLVGGEQLVLGGNDSVRGFAPSVAFGDTGLSWRNQLGTACLPGLLPRLQCFAFADAGLVRALVAPPTRYLAGGGAGARLDYPMFFAEASAGLPLHASAAIDQGRGEFHVQLGARY